VATVTGTDPKALRGMVDQLKDKLKSAVVLLATVSDGKISLVAGVTSDLTDRVKAGELVGQVAAQVGGKGGGRPDMAMGGGADVQALPAAMSGGESWVRERFAQQVGA
jgi:alanyl-tRNA synthetase